MLHFVKAVYRRRSDYDNNSVCCLVMMIIRTIVAMMRVLFPGPSLPLCVQHLCVCVCVFANRVAREVTNVT